MSAHLECNAAGKFDCLADQYIHGVTLEDGSGEGNVESPVAWFAEVTLLEEDHKDRAAAEHYGARWLIAREFNTGQFAVEVYDTEQQRDERLGELRAAYAEWDVTP